MGQHEIHDIIDEPVSFDKDIELIEEPYDMCVLVIFYTKIRKYNIYNACVS